MIFVVKGADERYVRAQTFHQRRRNAVRAQTIDIGRQRQIINGFDAGVFKLAICRLIEQKHIIAGLYQRAGIQRCQRAVVHVGNVF